MKRKVMKRQGQIRLCLDVANWGQAAKRCQVGDLLALDPTEHACLEEELRRLGMALMAGGVDGEGADVFHVVDASEVADGGAWGTTPEAA